MSLRKPDNWYELSYERQEEWKRMADEVERAERSAEYDRQRLEDDLESARARSRRQERAATEARNAITEERDSLSDENSELAGRLANLQERHKALLDACKALVKWMDDKGASCTDGAIAKRHESEALADARAAIAKAEAPE